MNNKKVFLSELPKEEIKKMILYPSGIWNDMYNIVAEDNSEYANDLMGEILGKDWHEWVEVDSCSYTWWINIRPGRYGEVLHINQYDYFSEDDANTVKRLQKEVKKLSDKVGNLDGDDPEYYDKLNEWEDKADELANDVLKIVENLAKDAEEVTDDQIVDTFIENDYGDLYWFYEGDKGTVYRDYTKTYNTNYKGE